MSISRFIFLPLFSCTALNQKPIIKLEAVTNFVGKAQLKDEKNILIQGSILPLKAIWQTGFAKT